MTQIQQILNAKSPEQVFGELADATADALNRAYRRLSRLIHPDVNGNSKESTDAFAKLNEWKVKAAYKIKHGTYGDEAAPSGSATIKTKRNSYTVVETVAAGDLSDVLLAKDINSAPVALKVIRTPANNDLGRREVEMLRTVREQCDGLPALAHVPQVLENFLYKTTGSTVQKQVNVFPALLESDGWYSAKRVLENYPEGIDLRDAAWMFNRLLGALLMAHQAGVVHAAVAPSHLMLHLPTHNAVLVDWSYAVKVGETAKALSPELEAFVPTEVRGKLPLTPGTDLHMAARLLLTLVGGENKLPQHPPSVRGLFRACQLAPNKRLTDVAGLYEKFNDELKRLYGPRKFRNFEMRS